MNKEEMIEKLSDIEHDRWCNWQRYLHSCCIKNEDGSLTIPKILVERWEYEINTKYNNLPDNIKESDRKETYKIIPIIDEYLKHQLEEKDKVIDEILNHPFFTSECPCSSIGDGFVQELCDCDNCQEDYKKCWIKYFKNEILERGKNGK